MSPSGAASSRGRRHAPHRTTTRGVAMGYKTIIRRHAILIMLVAVVAALAAAFGSLLQDTKYTASAAVRVHDVTSPFRSSGGTKSDLTRAMQTQIDLITG